MTQNFLALDLGASNGRAVIGRFDGSRLALEEIHRFPNGPVALPRLGAHVSAAQPASLYWDALALFCEVKQGLAKAVKCCGPDLASAGLDTWGVDFALLDRQGGLIGNPYHYRDSRTDGMVEEACRRVPREEIFASTGIQFMQLNTLIQLFAMAEQRSPLLDIADRLLMMPDLLNYFLTGQRVSEYTDASTSQCMDMRTGRWANELIARLGIPTHIFPPVVQPGTVLGPLLPAVAEEIAAGGIVMVAPGTHDTGSAVAAVPAESDDYAYLSSGTWSLIGVESRQAVINDKTLAFNFTNEGGVCNTIRLLKNIAGLWLIQECRRVWQQEGTQLSWSDITALAADAPPFTAVLDVDAKDFLAPGDMPARIRDYCARTGQPVPGDRGTIARVVFESLALRYRHVQEMMDDLVGRRIGTLHIVGGGSQNRMVNQFAADCIGRPVVAGPVEATAIGNLLMQMLAMHAIGSLEEGRQVVRNSFATERFEPDGQGPWDEAYERFKRLIA
jgi:sugar (pentulose or hexulose) kinase